MQIWAVGLDIPFIVFVKRMPLVRPWMGADTTSKMGAVLAEKLDGAVDEIARIISYWDDFNDWTYCSMAGVTISTECGA